MSHPRSTRRAFLRRAGLTAAGLCVPSALAACGTTAPLPAPGGAASGQIRGEGPGGLALARPNVPVSLPIYPDNPAIKSGLKPEKGPLQLYNWEEYINPTVVNSFQKKYGVKVQISTFTTHRRGGGQDLQRPGPVRRVRARARVPRAARRRQAAVAAQPGATSPTSRPTSGPRWSTPGTTTAASTRCPTRSTRPGSAGAPTSCRASTPTNYANPWSALWERGPEDQRHVSGCSTTSTRASPLGLLHNGSHRRQHRQPGRDHRRPEGDPAARLQRQPEVRHQRVPAPGRRLDAGCTRRGRATWPPPLPTPPKGRSRTAFAYWWPADGRGPDRQRHARDRARRASNPVLAHLFLNHVLDVEQAFSNYSYIFYQQPLNAMTPGGGGQEGPRGAQPAEHADRGGPVQARASCRAR